MISATRPLALRLAPDTALWRVALVVVGSLALALSAQLAVPLPFSPVPVTGQTFAVLLLGATLGSRLGAATVLLYLAEGAAGLPVFAGGTSAWSPSRIPGVAVAFGPTAGYLLGFVVAAFVVGYLAERGWLRRVRTAALAMLAGEVAIYAVALPLLARFVPLEGLLAAGLLPFIPGDLYKAALAALCVPTAARLIRR